MSTPPVDTRPPRGATAETAEKRQPVAPPAPFERPQVRRLGALPTVTAAFGGSFTP